MERYEELALQLRDTKIMYERMQAEADDLKASYELLRKELADAMVAGEMFKFEIKPSDGLDGLSFGLESKERWSPVVENKDKLYALLQRTAPDLFTINAKTLSKYISDIKEANNDTLPPELDGLVKCYDDTHVVVRKSRKSK